MNNNLDIFSLFERNVKPRESKPFEGFPIGLMVHSYCIDKQVEIFCVAGPPDEKGNQKIVLTSTYIEGKSTLTGTINKDTCPLSEKKQGGVYYDDMEGYIYSKNDVDRFIKRAEELTEHMRLKEDNHKKEKEEIESLVKRFPHLTPLPNGNYDYKIIRKNIVEELKKHFPEQKFSITKSDYLSISVNWTNGVSQKGVEEVIEKFQDHHGDMTGSYYDYEPSTFNKLFGGIKYVNANRERTEEIDKLVGTVQHIYPDLEKYVYFDLMSKVFYRTSFPSGANNLKIVRNSAPGGTLESCLDFTYDVVPEKEKQIPEGGETGLRVIDYSPKSIAVFGNTYPVKDQLFSLGGLFRYNLKGGPGFIFKKDKREKVLSLIETLNHQTPQ